MLIPEKSAGSSAKMQAVAVARNIRDTSPQKVIGVRIFVALAQLPIELDRRRLTTETDLFAPLFDVAWKKVFTDLDKALVVGTDGPATRLAVRTTQLLAEQTWTALSLCRLLGLFVWRLKSTFQNCCYKPNRRILMWIANVFYLNA